MPRFFPIFTIFVFIFGMAALAQAENEIHSRGRAFFGSCGTIMSRQGGGAIKIVFTANGKGICDVLGVANYEVEQLNDAGTWVACTGFLDGHTGTHVGSYTFSRCFYGIPGKVYRVKATFVCTMEGARETKSYTSDRIEA